MSIKKYNQVLNQGLNPLISVIIPTYNGEKYLTEAIDSVLNQTYKNIEIIVVDDGSTSSIPKEICESYNNKVFYLKQDNAGVASARNTGINNSKGELIAFLDDDDIWLPDKLSKQVELYNKLISENRNAGLIYTNLIYLTSDHTEKYGTISNADGINYSKFIYKDIIGTPSSVVIPKHVFEAVGLFNELPEIQGNEDFELWLRIIQKFEIFNCEEYLTKYRIRNNSISKIPDLIVRANKLVLNANLKNFSEKEKARLKKHYQTVYAIKYRTAAYFSLFYENNRMKFLEYAKKGVKYNARVFGIKYLLYRFLSKININLIVMMYRKYKSLFK